LTCLHADQQCPAGAVCCPGRATPILCRQVARGHSGYRELLARLAAPPGEIATPRPIPASPRGRPKIGWLTPFAPMGGAERHLCDLIRHTRNRLDWVGACVLNKAHMSDAMLDEIRTLVPVYTEPLPVVLRSELVLTWSAGHLGRFVPKGADAPMLILISHSDAADPYTPLVLAHGERDIDSYVAVSRNALDAIPAHRRRDAVVISNGVDPARVAVTIDRGEVRRLWGIRPDQKVVGFLGRMSIEQKDPGALARAVPALPDEWVGVGIGDGIGLGGDYRRVRKNARRHAPGRVHFFGARSDVGNVLAAFDVVLVPSTHESYCYVLAEAMLAGRPLVATRCGLLADHVEFDGLYERIPARARGAVLAAAVLAAECGGPRVDRARRLAEERLSIEASIKHWGSHLERLVQARRNARWRPPTTSPGHSPAPPA
jgi:glycosyltransferase involved in cell wall biosynthesis